MTHSISALFISLLASLALLAMPAPSFASPAVLGTRKLFLQQPPPPPLHRLRRPSLRQTPSPQ